MMVAYLEVESINRCRPVLCGSPLEERLSAFQLQCNALSGTCKVHDCFTERRLDASQQQRSLKGYDASQNCLPYYVQEI